MTIEERVRALKHADRALQALTRDELRDEAHEYFEALKKRERELEQAAGKHSH
jgi:hypothetical protein